MCTSAYPNLNQSREATNETTNKKASKQKKNVPVGYVKKGSWQCPGLTTVDILICRMSRLGDVNQSTVILCSC
jgi:hypothetical protein